MVLIIGYVGSDGRFCRLLLWICESLGSVEEVKIFVRVKIFIVVCGC